MVKHKIHILSNFQPFRHPGRFKNSFLKRALIPSFKWFFMKKHTKNPLFEGLCYNLEGLELYSKTNFESSWAKWVKKSVGLMCLAQKKLENKICLEQKSLECHPKNLKECHPKNLKSSHILPAYKSLLPYCILVKT